MKSSWLAKAGLLSRLSAIDFLEVGLGARVARQRLPINTMTFPELQEPVKPYPSCRQPLPRRMRSLAFVLLFWNASHYLDLDETDAFIYLELSLNSCHLRGVQDENGLVRDASNGITACLFGE